MEVFCVETDPSFPTLTRSQDPSYFQITLRDLKGSAPCLYSGSERYLCLLCTCFEGEVHIDLGEFQNRDQTCVSEEGCGLTRILGGQVRCANTCRTQVLEMSYLTARLRAQVRDTPLGVALESAICAVPLHVHRPTNPKIVRSLNKLRALPLKGSDLVAPLGLSNLLEILWFFVQPEHNLRISEASLRMADEARSILASNIEEPPDLRTLAARVNVSLSKLKQVFTLTYGIPPYTYLRMLRMERALYLLQYGGRNVTETALEVGYSNLSHFSKIFVQYHGIKPSRIAKG